MEYMSDINIEIVKIQGKYKKAFDIKSRKEDSNGRAVSFV